MEFRFRFSDGPKKDGGHFVLLSNGLDHWKTKLSASLDCFIHEHIFLYALNGPGYPKVWFSNGSDHWKTEQNAAILSTIEKQNRSLPLEF